LISNQSTIKQQMKKLLLTTAALAFVASAFAQGTVQFNTRLTAGAPPYYSQVFSAEGDGSYRTGNTAANLPAGGATYTGAPLTGSGWTAQLFSTPGGSIPAGPLTPYGVLVTDSLVACPNTTTFRTGTSAGSVAGITATLANIPLDAASAVLQIRVFPTSFGSWANAVTAFNSAQPGIFLGASPMFVVNTIGGSVNTPPQLTGVSFNVVPAPEPSTFALAGMGLASLLIFRRRK
jgi:hypothetical protein